MWVLLLPLPWLLLGVLAAGAWRRGKPGCLFIGGVFIWPQSRALEALGMGPGAAWAISLAIMAVFAIMGYLVGLRLFPRKDENGRSDR